MKLTDPVEYMGLGGRLRYLAGSNEGDPIFGGNYIYNNLLWLRQDVERLGFPVSCNLYDNGALRPIKETFEGLQDAYDAGEDVGGLTADQRGSLCTAVLSFEETVNAEAATRIIASPVPRRFALDHLLDQEVYSASMSSSS